MLKRYTHTHTKAKKEVVKKLEKYLNIDNISHKLVTNDLLDKNQENDVINLSS